MFNTSPRQLLKSAQCMRARRSKQLSLFRGALPQIVEQVENRGRGDITSWKRKNKHQESFTTPSLHCFFQDQQFMRIFLCSLPNAFMTCKQTNSEQNKDVRDGYEWLCLGEVQTDYFTIMLDECVNSSNKEELAIGIRYVDVTFAFHEEFIGLYYCPDIKGNTIFSIVQDTLLRLNWSLHHDAMVNAMTVPVIIMAGSISGLKTQILQEKPRTLFTHCNGVH